MAVRKVKLARGYKFVKVTAKQGATPSPKKRKPTKRYKR
jgi:hypothetical protein